MKNYTYTYTLVEKIYMLGDYMLKKYTLLAKVVTQTFVT
ncbi:hypothetical protein bcere0019_28410 [Bacillus cereus Rock3-28]|nr:hypothetical protein bcere0019_28410 [Bacillus cereus Rock3-28]